MENGELWWWLIILGAGVLVLFVPQWLSRRKQAQRLAEFESGDRVVTIGGFIGTLTYINLEENVARLQLADNVEAEIVPGALSRRLRAGDSTETPEED
ncbi:MAG: preprotein translocase subunit YajC [Anaerolineae bacterium]